MDNWQHDTIKALQEELRLANARADAADLRAERALDQLRILRAEVEECVAHAA